MQGRLIPKSPDDVSFFSAIFHSHLSYRFSEKLDFHFSNSPRRITSGERFLVCIFFRVYGFREIIIFFIVSRDAIGLHSEKNEKKNP